VDRLEYTTPNDRFYDFCLWEYKPVASFENKSRSSSLLFSALDSVDFDNRIYNLIKAIRDGIGAYRTVWGVKKLGSEISLEFYFYDYNRRDRDLSISKLINILSPFFHCNIKVNEKHHYFMFSLDMHQDLVLGTENLSEVHMYIGNPGSTVSSGICYSLKETGTSLENFYFFFDAEKEMDDIMDKACCSAHLDSDEISVERIFWPELKNCKRIVISNKQSCDAIYFSGVNIDQFVFFLKRMKYPTEIISFVEVNRLLLDHQLYDVAFDYRMEGKDLKILKSSYYGIF